MQPDYLRNLMITTIELKRDTCGTEFATQEEIPDAIPAENVILDGRIRWIK